MAQKWRFVLLSGANCITGCRWLHWSCCFCFVVTKCHAGDSVRLSCVPSDLQPPGWAPFWFLLETVFTMMATKWWFSNSVITSALIYFTFYCKKELFLLPRFSFIYLRQRGPMDSYSVGYNPLLSLCILMLDHCRFDVWERAPFCDLLMCPH